MSEMFSGNYASEILKDMESVRRFIVLKFDALSHSVRASSVYAKDLPDAFSKGKDDFADVVVILPIEKAKKFVEDIKKAGGFE